MSRKRDLQPEKSMGETPEIGNRSARGDSAGIAHQTAVESALDLLNFPMELIPIINTNVGAGKLLRDAEYEKMIDSEPAITAGAGHRSRDGGPEKRKLASVSKGGVSTVGSSTISKNISSNDADDTEIIVRGSDEDESDEFSDDSRPKKFRIYKSIKRQNANLEIFGDSLAKTDKAGRSATKKIEQKRFIGAAPTTGRPPKDYCGPRCLNCIGEADAGCDFCCQAPCLDGFSPDQCFVNSQEMKDIIAKVPPEDSNRDKRRFVYNEVKDILANYEMYMMEHAGKIKKGLWPTPHCVGRFIRMQFPDPNARYTGFGNIGGGSTHGSSNLSKRSARRPPRPIGKGLNYKYEDLPPKSPKKELERKKENSDHEEEGGKKAVAKKRRLRL